MCKYVVWVSLSCFKGPSSTMWNLVHIICIGYLYVSAWESKFNEKYLSINRDIMEHVKQKMFNKNVQYYNLLQIGL